MSIYDFDGNKLTYHPDRVAQLIQKGDCAPIYMEISPMGSCNHRCVFCAYDFIGYPNRRLDTKRTLKLIDELAAQGVKSVLYAGEGEPLLHPAISELIFHTKNRGIDVGLYTNGQLLKPSLLPALTFVRISFNGGSPENYARIHSVSENVFERVLKNVRAASAFRDKEKLSVDLGAQYVLIPENMDHAFVAAKAMKEAGADYFVIKPFVRQSEKQGYQLKETMDPLKLEALFNECESLKSDTFYVIARRRSFENYGKRNYGRCYGASMISTLNSKGDLAACLPYWDDPEFIYGNINQQSFEKIWNGEKRKRIKKRLEHEMDVKRSCPPNCRANSINQYLWD